jgi:ATP-binding cassette subfamily B protein
MKKIMRNKKMTFFKPWHFLWQYLRSYKHDLLKSFGATVLTAVTILSAGYGLRQFVDQGAFSDGNVSVPVFSLMCASLIIAVSAYVRTSTTSWLSEQVVSSIKKDFLHHLLFLPQSFFESARLGDLLSRFQRDTHQIGVFLSASAPVLIRSGLQLIGGSILLILSSPQLTVMVFALIPFVIVPILLLGRKVQNLTRAVQAIDGQSISLVEESLTSISTVKAFTNERYCEDLFAQVTQEKLSCAQTRIVYRSLMVSLIIALVFMGIAVVLWAGIQKIQTGALTSGQLSAFIFYAILVAGSINSLADIVEESSLTLSAVSRIDEILMVSSDIFVSGQPLPFLRQEAQQIDFQSVSFYYPNHEGASLDQVTFSIKPKTTVALVGPSGAGKSTIFKLLLRLYEPSAGDIRLNGAPISSLETRELRSCFSFVPQDPVLFNVSLLENIRYGNPTASEEKILAAAHRAYVEEFASRLPQGYDTIVGEKGVRLSGGQKQRVALARAILKDAPVFLLDEATNALDSQSEEIVQSALKGILKEKTAVIIAHRLSTVQKADLILVLDHGRLIDQGQHQSLLKTCSLYKSLAETQLLTDTEASS